MPSVFYMTLGVNRTQISSTTAAMLFISNALTRPVALRDGDASSGNKTAFPALSQSHSSLEVGATNINK